MVGSPKKDTRRAGRVIARGFSTHERRWAGVLPPLPAPRVPSAEPRCPCTPNGAVPFSMAGPASHSRRDVTCSSVSGCEAKDAVAKCLPVPGLGISRAEPELEAQWRRDCGGSLVCKGPGDFCCEKIEENSPWTCLRFSF